LELQAVVLAFQSFHDEPVNIVTDSQYVYSLVTRLDFAALGHLANMALAELLPRLAALIQQRLHPFWCAHIKSHSNLPGFMHEGNRQIDQAVSLLPSPSTSLPVAYSVMQQAYNSHAFFHQSARALQREFQLSRSQARSIIAACPDCARLAPLQQVGVNP
ncbi:PO113 protein, partial [Geococcyx californianus]|nr:PO113 protein [Geococcyx californianus]